MNNLTEQMIGLYSTNANANANGRALAAKNAFPKLLKTEDNSLIFGECEGSARENYRCSADFLEPESPVFRCTCPSRQIPCKHVLGLMYSCVQGKNFSLGTIPDDILEKRDARQKKKEKNDSPEEKKPKEINKGALKKKIATQLEGLEILKKLLDEISFGGLGSINPKTYSLVDEQIKNLGNYYLSGVQEWLRGFNYCFRFYQDREKAYSAAIQYLNALYPLYKKGKEYLETKLNDPDLKMATDSGIEEFLGHIWQLDELERCGLVSSGVELVQLSFCTHYDNAELSFIDEGVWFKLCDCKLHTSLNYRPYRAAKHIKEDDSFFEALKAEKLFFYPGDFNNRIRWDNFSARKLESSDYARIKSSGNPHFQEVLRNVKNSIKNPLSNKFPFGLLRYSQIASVEDKPVAVDGDNTRIVLEDAPVYEVRTAALLKYLSPECLRDQALLVRFVYNLDSNFLSAQPLSIITDNRIIRLAF